MTSQASQGAVFVMPRTTREWSTASGVWIAASSWAAAARRRYGAAWVATPDGVWSPEDILEQIAPRSREASPLVRHAPVTAKTLVKDIRRYRRATAFHVADAPEWRDIDLQFVWQHHDLFHHGGEELARQSARPLVSFVHAPQVWEARQWGVHRPGWGPLLERYGERPQLLASDVVACVSDEVAQELTRFGVAEERVVICPTGVDPERFGSHVSGNAVRRRLGTAGSFTVGWLGSFRGFHGLDTLLGAFAELRARTADARLLLVGGGEALDSVEQLATRLGIADSVIFTGAVSYDDVPELIAAMDVAVVSASPDDGFHYSPQKLREYMAAGVAVVAADVPDVRRFVHDGSDALLFAVGDDSDLAGQLAALHSDPTRRAALGAAARSLVLASGTWDAQLDRLVSSSAYAAAVNRLRRGSLAG